MTRYRVKIRLKGYPPQTETHQRLGDAKRWARETEAAILEGRHFKTSEAKKHTLGELVDRYIRDVLPQKKKSEKKQTAQLLWWKGQIGSHLLADVTPALIAEKRDDPFAQAKVSEYQIIEFVPGLHDPLLSTQQREKKE